MRFLRLRKIVQITGWVHGAVILLDVISKKCYIKLSESNYRILQAFRVLVNVHPVETHIKTASTDLIYFINSPEPVSIGTCWLKTMYSVLEVLL